MENLVVGTLESFAWTHAKNNNPLLLYWLDRGRIPIKKILNKFKAFLFINHLCNSFLLWNINAQIKNKYKMRRISKKKTISFNSLGGH